MKTSKFFTPIISILLCLSLCSCGKNYTYKNDAEINFNYNNVSSGHSSFWVDDSGVYYSKHNLVFDIYKIDKNGKKRIDSVSDPSHNMQVYKNKMYYSDTTDDKYILTEYDPSTNKKKQFATIKSEFVYDFIISNDLLYIIEGSNDSFIMNLSAISLENGEKTEIKKDIFAYGFVDNALHYITQKNNKYTIYKYDTKSKKIGSFELDGKYDDISSLVNFTSDSIMLNPYDSSNIIVYNFKEKTLDTYKEQGYIDEIIAFEDSVFYTCWKEENLVLYCLNVETKTKKALDTFANFTNSASLFVASDEDVYISLYEPDDIRRYSLDGNFEKIIIS